MPCCEVLNFSLNGSRMFTGVSRMECKALATQMALMRWQLHQQPWASRTSDEVGLNGGAVSPVYKNSSSSTPEQSSPAGLQEAMDTAQVHNAQSPRADGSQTTAASSRQQRQYVMQPLAGSKRQKGPVQWVKAATAPVPQRPLPSLAQLRAERVRDQRTRDALKGSILRGCGCRAWLMSKL